MSIYKKASKSKLRFSTRKGVVNVEQLWDLSMSDLSDAIKHVKKVISESSNDDELSFLSEEANTVNPEHQLIFDILKDVYISKKEERDSIKQAAEIKAHNEKILALIHAKQEQSLNELSEEELKSLLK